MRVYIGFALGLFLGSIIILFIIPNNYVLVSNKHLVKKSYGYYNADKNLVIKDDFKKYYEEEK